MVQQIGQRGDFMPQDFSHLNLTLSSHCLLSKWGFGDGDQFSDFVVDNGYYAIRNDKELACDKEVLKRAVERFLLPKLPTPVKIYTIVTHHNPIRVVDEDYEELETQPEVTVTLTEQQLHEICQEVYDEYVARDGIKLLTPTCAVFSGGNLSLVLTEQNKWVIINKDGKVIWHDTR